MSWAWPTTKNPHCTVLVRIGRVLHWVFIVLAGFGMMFGWVVQRVEANNSIYMAVVTGLIFAVRLVMIGRGLRYILSAE